MYHQKFTVSAMQADCHHRAKPSVLLFMAQEAAGGHCRELALSWDALQKKQLFWAVIRHKMQITRLPMEGETVTVETWPMPTTRSAFPRATVAYDENGNEVFRSVALWVLMHTESRSMVLPGKSGIALEGTLTGNELALPASIVPKVLENSVARTVRYSELDRNGHMNNTRYMEWCGDLLPSGFHHAHTPRDFTVCYHAEALEGENLELHYELKEGGLLQVDAWRNQENDASVHSRVFTAQVQYEADIL